jgi:predicted CopG family antitoxin
MIKLKTIAISIDNYETLRNLGRTADSFNDVITDLLNDRKGTQKENIPANHQPENHGHREIKSSGDSR